MTNSSLQLDIFFLLNFIGVATGFIWTVFLNKFKPTSIVKIIMSTGLLFGFEIVFVETVLGIFGVLFFPVVFGSFALIFAMTLILFYKKLAVSWKSIVQKIDKFPWVPFVFMMVPVFVIMLLQIFHATLRIPMDYDSVTYHLPIAVEWMRSGDIKNIFYSPLLGPVSYYAGNYQLLLLYLLMPFQKDYLVTLINFPIIFFACFAFYQVARNFKLSKHASVFAAALFAGAPMVLILLGSQMVELAICLTFLLAVYFLQEYFSNGNISDAMLFGLAGGLLIGIKQTGIIYFAPLGLAFFIIFVMKYAADPKGRARLMQGILSAGVCVFLAGCYWYVRNWASIGQPFYPVELDFFKGTSASFTQMAASSAIFSTSLAGNVKDLDKLFVFSFYFIKKMGVQIYLAFFVFIVGPLVAIVSSFKKNLKNDGLMGLLILAPIVYFLLYWNTPYTGADMTVLIHNMRFALVFLLMLMIGAAYFLEKIRAPKWLFYVISLGIFFYNVFYNYFKSPLNPLFNDFINLDMNLIKDNIWIFLGFVFLMMVVLLSIAIFFSKRYKNWVKIVLLLIVVLLSNFYFAETWPKREALRAANYQIWQQGDWHSMAWINAAEWFNENANNARIALAGFPYNYPFYGRDLQRFVEYINVNSCMTCTTSDYYKNHSDFRENPDFNSWIANLKINNIDYVVLEPTNDLDSFEYNAALAHPELFQPVYANESAAIYKFI